MRTYNFNAHTMEVFSEMNTNYEAMSNLMTDVALKHEIYDAETDKVISSAEANAKIKIAQAEGEAKALKIKADGEAYYNRTVAASITELLVRQDAIDKWDAVEQAEEMFACDTHPEYDIDVNPSC